MNIKREMEKVNYKSGNGLGVGGGESKTRHTHDKGFSKMHFFFLAYILIN